MQNRVQVLEYIAGLLEKKQALPKEVALQDYCYIDCGHIDSLALMKFILDIEDKFQIEISDDDMLSDAFKTVGGLVDIIIGKLN